MWFLIIFNKESEILEKKYIIIGKFSELKRGWNFFFGTDNASKVKINISWKKKSGEFPKDIELNDDILSR